MLELSRTSTHRRIAAVGCVVLGLSLFGCADVLNMFDPTFLEALGAQSRGASIPGDAPAVLVEVENRTGRNIEAQLSWRAGDSEVDFSIFGSMAPGEKQTQVLICPVDEITLGDVGDLDQTGAFVRLGDGGSNAPFLAVEPFGVLLKEGANYNCGDLVTFAIQPSSATRSGYQVFAFIRRAETLGDG